MSNLQTKNVKALLVSRQTYEHLESLFGSLEHGADDAINAMIPEWLANRNSQRQPIVLPENAPLHHVNRTAISSAIVQVSGTTARIYEDDGKSAPTWNRLIAWLADHVATDRNGRVSLSLDAIPEGMAYAVSNGADCDELFERGGATIQTIPTRQGDWQRSPDGVVVSPRGWHYAPDANVLIRISSAMQSMRLIRHVMHHVQPDASITINFTSDRKPGTATMGQDGNITFVGAGHATVPLKNGD